MLLMLLGPLMVSLLWVAVRFPIYYPDYVGTTWHEVEPEKLFVIFERYGKDRGPYDSRAWLLDIEAETLEPLKCPEEFGEKWPNLIGKDASGNLIFETQSGGPTYVGWNARTGVHYRVNGILTQPVLINDRYLACTQFEESVNGHSFVWFDLSNPERPPRIVPIMETNSNMIPIEGTDSFYFVLPANYEVWYQADSSEGGWGYGMGTYYGGTYGGGTYGYGGEGYGEEGYFTTEWVNEDGQIEYELPPAVINPNASKPLPTVVLMNLTEQGPKEVTRWPVVSDSSSEVTHGAGYVVCQSVDARFLETHDARNGNIVARIPIPTTALDTTMPTPRLNWWSLAETVIQFGDGCGNRVAMDCRTGIQLDSFPVGSGWLLPIVLGHDHEYLTWSMQTQPADWPGKIQVRATEDHQVLYSWAPPEPNIFSGNDDGHPKFSSDGHSVRFITSDMRVVYADKCTGKLVRHIQPRFWLPFIAAALAVAAGVWTRGWIMASIRDRLPCWVDVFVILGCALSFLYWRIIYSGNLYDEQRPAWIGIAGLLIAVLVLTVDQVAFSKARLLYRCSPIILLTVASIFVQRSWLGEYSADVIVFELLLVAVILMGSMAIHALFLREPRKQLAVSKKTRIVSLRELFAWTALAALMLAAFKLYEFKEWTRGVSVESIVQDLIYAGVIAAVSLSAYYLTAKRSGLLVRLLALGAFLLLAITSAVYRLEWDELPSELAGIEIEIVVKACERVLIIALASMLIALPIGMRNTQSSIASTSGLASFLAKPWSTIQR